MNCNSDVLDFFDFCHKCGKSLGKSTNEERSKPQTSQPQTSQSQTSQPQTSQPQTFQQFKKHSASERLQNIGKKKKQETQKEVQVYIGILKLSEGVLEPAEEKVMLVRVPKDISKLQLLSNPIDKHAAYDKKIDPYASYALAYPEGSEVLTIPGQPSQLFQLDRYKEDISKPCNRITLYLVETPFRSKR